MNDLDSMMRLAKRSGCVLELVVVGELCFGPRLRRLPRPPKPVCPPSLRKLVALLDVPVAP